MFYFLIFWENISCFCAFKNLRELVLSFFLRKVLNVNRLFTIKESVSKDVNKFDKKFTLGNKICLAVDFDHHCFASAWWDKGGDDSFSGFFISSFLRSEQSFLFEPPHSSFIIIVAFLQSFLAFSHRGTCLFSKSFYRLNGHFECGEHAGHSAQHYILIVALGREKNTKEGNKNE